MNSVILDSKQVPNPESRAVLQALSSRSTADIRDQMQLVNADKTEKFIDVNCIGYGHDSVMENADSIIINVRGLSMLAAKALEDTPLFKGTEASTRYINVTGMPFISAHSTDKETQILETQRAFFDDNYEEQVSYNKTVYPREPGQDEKTHDKAIRAKTFDIMRSLLPAGATTIVNWSTDLRVSKDRLRILETHPLKEIRQMAAQIARQLINEYVSYKDYTATAAEIEDHISEHALEYHYYEEDPVYQEMDYWDNPNYLDREFDIGFCEESLAGYATEYPSLLSRPRGCPPPRMYGNRFVVSGLIDFGSFRDIQRHRNNICKIPVLGTRIGFEPWYLKQMSPALQEKVKYHLEWLVESIQSLEDVSRLDAQYLVPFGYRVPFTLDMDLAQMIYFTELRSSKHVHPTARAVALHTADFMDEFIPNVKLYVDRSLDGFSIKRASHDIIIK